MIRTSLLVVYKVVVKKTNTVIQNYLTALTWYLSLQSWWSYKKECIPKSKLFDVYLTN